MPADLCRLWDGALQEVLRTGEDQERIFEPFWQVHRVRLPLEPPER